MKYIDATSAIGTIFAVCFAWEQDAMAGAFATAGAVLGIAFGALLMISVLRAHEYNSYDEGLRHGVREGQKTTGGTGETE